MDISTVKPEIMEYGVGGALAYFLLKLMLDFLAVQRREKAECLRHEEWEKWRDSWERYLVNFHEHHNEDRQLLKICESLEAAVRNQTTTFATMASSMQVTADALKQLLKEIRKA